MSQRVIVIGAGQAGLSVAHHLLARGLRPWDDLVVLDANAGPGGAWQHRWPTLTWRHVHGVHELPGSVVPDVDPDEPAAAAVAQYFADYEHSQDIPLLRPVRVHSVTSTGPHRSGPLTVAADDGRTWTTASIVNATGTWTRPHWPYYPGMESFAGRQLHTADYRGSGEFAGRRVVVVGAGASATQLLAEISQVATTLWVSRRAPQWRTSEFTPAAGSAAVALVEDRVRSGLPPQSVVSVTGLIAVPEVQAAIDTGRMVNHSMFSSIEPAGVRWSDGEFWAADVILWCTGFRAELRHLAPLHLRGEGETSGGIAMDGPRTVPDPRVFLVGYGPSSSTIGANRAGRAVARLLTANR